MVQKLAFRSSWILCLYTFFLRPGQESGSIAAASFIFVINRTAADTFWLYSDGHEDRSLPSDHRISLIYSRERHTLSRRRHKKGR